VCRRCQRAGRECVRGYNVRFRYGTDLGDDSPAGGRAAGGRQGEFRFGQDQIWLRTSGDGMDFYQSHAWGVTRVRRWTG